MVRPPGPLIASSSSTEKSPNSRSWPTTTPKQRRNSGSYSETYHVHDVHGAKNLTCAIALSPCSSWL